MGHHQAMRGSANSRILVIFLHAIWMGEQSLFHCLVSSHMKNLWFRDILYMGLNPQKGFEQYTLGGLPKWVIDAQHIIMFITNNICSQICSYPFRTFVGLLFVDYYVYLGTTIISLVFNVYVQYLHYHHAHLYGRPNVIMRLWKRCGCSF